MKSAEDIKKYFQKATLSTNPDRHEAIFEKIQRAQDQSKITAPALSGLNLRSKIMKSPITKLAAAAVIIILVVTGLFEFIGTENTSGVVWANVIRKVELSRGLVVRCTESFSSIPESLSFLNDSDYSIKHICPTHSRTDFYKKGKMTRSYYTDFSDSDIDTLTHVYHMRKRYFIHTYKKSKYEFLLEQHDDWINPKYLIQTILSCKHRKLGQKTIDGVLCEGIETTDPTSMGPVPELLEVLEVQLQLWVDAKTEYPVQFNSKKKMSIKLDEEVIMMASEGVIDQFQWDVALDPGIFEPNIPPDYESVERPGVVGQ